MGKYKDKILKIPTEDEAAYFLADHVPSGRLVDKKYDLDSNIGRLMKALASVFVTVHQLSAKFISECNLYETIDLIEKWEESVKIPDDCTQPGLSLEVRRQEVIARLRKKPNVTIADYLALLNPLFPGIEIKIYPGKERYSYDYDYDFNYAADVNLRFVLSVVLPVGTPQADIDRMQCTIRRFLPANVLLSFEFEPI